MTVARHVGLKRLLKLADYLDTVPPETFDMGTWWCGTKGCALGHAAQMPAFRRLGLRVMPYEHTDGCGVTLLGAGGGFSAAEALFGLTAGDAEYLFRGTPRTPADVAGEIRAFVARERAKR